MKFNKKINIKIWISKIICSNISGFIIGLVYSNKIKFRNLTIDTSSTHINSRTKAYLFWGIYESAEARFILKYVQKGRSVIELGASLGVITSLIGKSIGKDGYLISVEGNSNLLNIINTNLQKNNLFNVSVLNKMVDYNAEDLGYSKFNISKDHLTSSTQKSSNTINEIDLPTITLKQLSEEFDSNELILVSDIEGAEIGFILKERELSNFNLLIIELHQTLYQSQWYSVSMMVNLITQNHGFKVKDFYGDVFVFERQDFSCNKF